MPSHPPRLRSRLLLALGSTLLLVALPEVGLRLAGAGPALRRGELAPDPDLLWVLSPGVQRPMGRDTHINDLGLQGPAPTAHPRLLATGDSSVFGVSIQDAPTFSQLLGQALGAEVHNGGVPGYSSTQSRAQVDRVWGALDPELLVVANLWSDNNFDSFVDDEELALAGRPGRRWAHLLGRGAMRSATLAALARWSGAAKQETVGWGQRGQETMLGLRRVPLSRYVENLDALATRAREDGAGVVFLMLPNTEDVDHPDRPWPWDPYRRVMREVARAHGCPLVDGPALMRGTGQPARALFSDEMHPSATGHRVLGEGLARAVQTAGWPDASGLCTGPGSPVVDLADPWTWPAGEPPSGAAPLVAGVLRGPTDRHRPLVARLVGGDGQVLDQVDLPGPAPFALQAASSQMKASLEVWSTQPGRQRLLAHDLDLSRGPLWGLSLSLP